MLRRAISAISGLLPSVDLVQDVGQHEAPPPPARPLCDATWPLDGADGAQAWPAPVLLDVCLNSVEGALERGLAG